MMTPARQWSAPGYAVLALGLVIVGLAFTAATDAVLGAVPASRAGAASAISEMSYELGIALGIALLGTMHTVLYRASLPDLAALPAASRDAVTESLAGGIPAPPGEPGLLAAARDAFGSAMQTTSAIAALLLVVAAVVAWRVVGAAARPLPKVAVAAGQTGPRADA